MNVDVVIEAVLYLHKQESTKVNVNLHQGSTCLREIQFLGNMDIYTDTLSVMNLIIMGNFADQCQDKNRKQLILQRLELY